MEKNSTLFYFINTYHNEKISLGKLDLGGEKQDVKKRESKQHLFEPSTKSVNAILNFSKSYDVLFSEVAGCIELNKN